MGNHYRKGTCCGNQCSFAPQGLISRDESEVCRAPYLVRLLKKMLHYYGCLQTSFWPPLTHMYQTGFNCHMPALAFESIFWLLISLTHMQQYF